MAATAGIKPRGSIHFHLLRKFLIRQLNNVGLNELHVKFLVGKNVPGDISTYLQSNTDQLTAEYTRAYPQFCLSESNKEPLTQNEELGELVRIQQKTIAELTERLKQIENAISVKVENRKRFPMRAERR